MRFQVPILCWRHVWDPVADWDFAGVGTKLLLDNQGAIVFPTYECNESFNICNRWYRFTASIEVEISPSRDILADSFCDLLLRDGNCNFLIVGEY